LCSRQGGLFARERETIATALDECMFMMDFRKKVVRCRCGVVCSNRYCFKTYLGYTLTRLIHNSFLFPKRWFFDFSSLTVVGTCHVLWFMKLYVLLYSIIPIWHCQNNINNNITILLCVHTIRHIVIHIDIIYIIQISKYIYRCLYCKGNHLRIDWSW